MRLTIQRKIFLWALLLSTAAVVILASVIRFNLGQGFERYTVATELSRLDWLVRNIESEYATSGSWDFLQRSPERVWRRLSRPHPEARFSSPADATLEDQLLHRPPQKHPDGDNARDVRPPQWDEGESSPPPSDRSPPPNDPLNIGPRLTLLDRQGQRLAGARTVERLSASVPIYFHGEMVGKLILNASRTSPAALDDAFLSSQTKSVAWIGLMVLALTLLAAWVLVRHLIAPIRDLSEGARGVAEGKLNIRIPVRSDDELGRLARHFNLMIERLERLETTRRNWISDASHELRTPLAVLRAEIEALEDGVRVAEAATYSRLHKQVQQLSGLVEDLRHTLDQGLNETLMDQGLFSPLEVLEEVIENFEQRYAQAQLRMERIGVRESSVLIRGDAGRLNQVFSNLLENTLRYTDAGGCLRITVRTMDHWLLLDFEDTAPAPSRREIPCLFDRFFRAEPSRSRELGGAGLGLSICKNLVEAHGGEINGRLSPLGGLGILIKLPIENR